jgi:hypothetical protein
MSTSLDFGRNISAKKVPPAAATSWVEALAARLADLKQKYNNLDETHWRIEPAMARLEYESESIEKFLSILTPKTLVDVTIMLTLCRYRLTRLEDAKKAAEEAGRSTAAIYRTCERDVAVLKNTLDRVITALEKLAGVSLESLGLDDYRRHGYRRPSLAVEELLEAAAQGEAEHAGHSLLVKF